MNRINLFIYQNNLIKLKKVKAFRKLQIFKKFIHNFLVKYLYLKNYQTRSLSYFNSYYLFFIFHKRFYRKFLKYLWHVRNYKRISNHFLIFSYHYYLSYFSSILRYLVLSLKKEIFSIFLVSSRYKLEWVIKQINYRLLCWIKKWRNIFLFSESNFLEFLRVFSIWLFEKQCSYVNKNFIRKSTLWKIKYYFGPFNPYSSDFWVFGDRNSATYLIKYL